MHGPIKRKSMIDKHSALSVKRQCVLLSVSRSSLYYRRVSASEHDDSMMREIDRINTDKAFYGVTRREGGQTRHIQHRPGKQVHKRQIRVVPTRGKRRASIGHDRNPI